MHRLLRPALVTALFGLLPSCIALHYDRGDYTFVATDLETGRPLAGVPVFIHYGAVALFNPPGDVEGVTDEWGVFEARLIEWRYVGIQVGNARFYRLSPDGCEHFPTGTFEESVPASETQQSILEDRMPDPQPGQPDAVRLQVIAHGL